ncbi:unnamed protein product [Camellia sinensis]
MHSKLAKFHLIIHLLLLSCLGGLFSLSLYLVFSHAFTCHPNFSYKADVKHLFVYLFCFFDVLIEQVESIAEATYFKYFNRSFFPIFKK